MLFQKLNENAPEGTADLRSDPFGLGGEFSSL
jgi:hypothetical protein